MISQSLNFIFITNIFLAIRSGVDELKLAYYTQFFTIVFSFQKTLRIGSFMTCKM